MTDHLFLPSKEDVDKLLRYEAMINKQLNHAIAELERLQRRSNAESVPAPVSVDVLGHARTPSRKEMNMADRRVKQLHQDTAKTGSGQEPW